MKRSTWYVYMLKCADNSLYTGIATDIERRFNEHNQGKQGAKYTRSRRLVKLVYQEQYASRGEAQSREWVIKQLTRAQKLALTQTPVAENRRKMQET